ncbi:MAG: UDP-N-acetylmuramoyl-L-alanine--D-glutamate ligase, partial [Chloroflexota bacterium]
AALSRYLVKHGQQVTVTDLRPADELRPFIDRLAGLPLELALGGHPEEALRGADTVFLSAGVRRDVPPFAGLPNISSETELFFQRCPAPIIGITGSAGKTTTTTLTGLMLAAGVRRVLVGGNIGQPLIEEVDELTGNELVVLELSSFQLEYLRQSPHVALVTNITPNHLDRHPSMQAYINAKANIVRHQAATDVAILNGRDANSSAFAAHTPARTLYFNGRDAHLEGDRLLLRTHDAQHEICRLGELQIPGRHNVDNVLAASLIALAHGIAPQAIRDVAIRFTGVRHRLQLVRELRGVAYYNDSIATAPERTLAALAVFERPIVLIAGGRDKHLPVDELAERVCAQVRGAILVGEAASLLEGAFAAAKRRLGVSQPWLRRANDLGLAVELAAEQAREGDVVLLSPACTSYDMFRDFEERGECFVTAVEALT